MKPDTEINADKEIVPALSRGRFRAGVRVARYLVAVGLVRVALKIAPPFRFVILDEDRPAADYDRGPAC